MNTRQWTLIALLLSGALMGLQAQEARFFRVSAPVDTAITNITSDGHATWTNEVTEALFTIQMATSLNDGGNWADWVQVPVTNTVTTHRLFDPDSPSGMVFVPGGIFTMGDSLMDGFSVERPPHAVNTSAFYMDKFEVTKSLWNEVYSWAVTNGYNFDNSGLGKSNNHPVSSINWHDAVKWCNARSQKENLTPCYYTDAGQGTIYKMGTVGASNTLALTNACVKWTANGYRLPTEAEWEKAARGGAIWHRFPWSDSDDISHTNANYKAANNYVYDLSYPVGFHPLFIAGSYYTSPVGHFAPNSYGLYDMAGNVSEFCWDWYANDYYSWTPESNPRGPDEAIANRVYRGGDWANDALHCRPAHRDRQSPDAGNPSIGFRCVRLAPQ